MDPLIAKLAGRFKTALSVVDRIQAIPGYQRSNFLMSLLQQAQRGRSLSEKQLAVLDKIEKDQGSRAPAPEKAPSNAIEWAKGGYFNSKDGYELVRQLKNDGEALVFDSRGHFMSKANLHFEYVRKELASYFAGVWENYNEMNADEDDPRERDLNYQVARQADTAARFIHEKLKIEAKPNGRLVKVTISPTMTQIEQRLVPALKAKRDWR